MENIYKLIDSVTPYDKNKTQNKKDKLVDCKGINRRKVSPMPSRPLYNNKSLEKNDPQNIRYTRQFLDNKVDASFSKISKSPVKISSRKYNSPIKTGPFETKHLSSFAHVYISGGLPIKFTQGHVNLKLIWDIEPEFLNYDPVLFICFEGLLELAHPYAFLARQTCYDMLKAKNAANKILPMLGRLIKPLRNALSSNSEEIFRHSLNIAIMISHLVKDNLNDYLHFLVHPINKWSKNM